MLLGSALLNQRCCMCLTCWHGLLCGLPRSKPVHSVQSKPHAAGSERQKDTGASGQQLTEGININKGLLALVSGCSLLAGQQADAAAAGMCCCTSLRTASGPAGPAVWLVCNQEADAAA